MDVNFQIDQSLKDFQEMIQQIYGVPDDRLYSLWDLLIQQQRFSMRALKGIRKQDNKKIKINLLISLSWVMSIANRLHIDLDEEVWKRFPNKCSYCGKTPCVCKKIKPTKRIKVSYEIGEKPQTITDMQAMFERIYPSKSRTLEDAGIHLAEEVGEVSESIHNFLGSHHSKLFSETQLELADYISCTFGVANSANIDVAKELSALFKNNCHVCHKTPCECSFSAVTKFNI